MTVHTFPTSGDAYDACQIGFHFFTDPSGAAVETGDTLVIESERVVGICDTWPVAVTTEFGKLHTPAEGYTLVECFERRRVTPEHVAAAKAEAEKRSWAVRA